MNYLRLKLKEHRYPAVFVRKMNKKTAICIYPIVFGKTAGIPLVHMNIVNALTGSKIKVLIRRLFRCPFAAKGINKSAFGSQCFFNPDVKDVVEVVVGSIGSSG